MCRRSVAKLLQKSLLLRAISTKNSFVRAAFQEIFTSADLFEIFPHQRIVLCVEVLPRCRATCESSLVPKTDCQ